MWQRYRVPWRTISSYVPEDSLKGEDASQLWPVLCPSAWLNGACRASWPAPFDCTEGVGDGVRLCDTLSAFASNLVSASETRIYSSGKATSNYIDRSINLRSLAARASREIHMKCHTCGYANMSSWILNAFPPASAPGAAADARSQRGESRLISARLSLCVPVDVADL
jgi:hypothetical protein